MNNTEETRKFEIKTEKLGVKHMLTETCYCLVDTTFFGDGESCNLNVFFLLTFKYEIF